MAFHFDHYEHSTDDSNEKLQRHREGEATRTHCKEQNGCNTAFLWSREVFWGIKHIFKNYILLAHLEKVISAKCLEVSTIRWSQKAEEGVTQLSYLLLSTATPTVLLGVAMLATKLHWRAWGSHLWETTETLSQTNQCLLIFNSVFLDMQCSVKTSKQISQNVIKTVIFFNHSSVLVQLKSWIAICKIL